MLALFERLGGIEDVGLGLRWNAATLRREIDRRAALLTRMRIQRGSVVVIAHGATARFFADLFATWSVGAAAVCLDPTLTPNELRNVIEFAKSAVVLVDGATTIDHISAPIVDLGAESSASSFSATPPLEADDPALVLFTSGTTGAPKGVVLSFRALQARILANISAIGADTLARTLVSLPTHFGHGLIGNSLTPLLAGGDIVLHPLGIPMSKNLGRIIDEHNITFMSSVPTLWRLALPRSDKPAKGSLIRVHIGSAPLSANLWRDVANWTGAETVNCYGTTETANWIAGASSRSDGVADGLIGKMWGGSVAVIDETGSINLSGAGELIVRSPSMMSGYLDRPDLTAAVLYQGWYRTGDRGLIDERGSLWLTGRIRDEINRAGFKVQPAEIDMVLEGHSAIAEACVFGMKDPLAGEAIGAAIRFAEGASATSRELQAWCRGRLRRDTIPEHWFIVSEIPRSARGKVSRDAVCRALVKQQTVESTGLGSGSSLRKTEVFDGPAATEPRRLSVRTAVERAWSKILGEESFGADVSLAEAGGDSLDALRMWLLIEKWLGTRLSMDVLGDNLTSNQIITALERQLRGSFGEAILAPSGPAAPPVFLMTPAGGDSLMLARFRAAFQDKINFILIEYPGWQQMIEAGAGFDVLADTAVSQILAQSRQDEACLLAGYSFGGLVAVEAARRLQKRGRRIGFIGLIDTVAAKPRAAQRRRWHNIISALISMSAFRILRMIGQLGAILPARRAVAVEFVLNEQLRMMSFRHFRLAPLQVPIVLYRSDEGASFDNGWHALGHPVSVVPIGGTHHSMLTPPLLEILCAHILEAVKPFIGARTGRRGFRPTVPEAEIFQDYQKDLAGSRDRLEAFGEDEHWPARPLSSAPR